MWMLFVLCIASVIACTFGRINTLCLVLMAMPCVDVAAQAYYSTLLSVKDHIVWKIVIVLSLHTLISQLPSLQCVYSHESNILTSCSRFKFTSHTVKRRHQCKSRFGCSLLMNWMWDRERTPPRCASQFYCCCGWLLSIYRMVGLNAAASTLLDISVRCAGAFVWVCECGIRASCCCVPQHLALSFLSRAHVAHSSNQQQTLRAWCQYDFGHRGSYLCIRNHLNSLTIIINQFNYQIYLYIFLDFINHLFGITYLNRT